MWQKLFTAEFVHVTHVEARVEQNVPERLLLAQNGIDQDDDRVVFNVFVDRLLAELLDSETRREAQLPAKQRCHNNPIIHAIILPYILSYILLSCHKYYYPVINTVIHTYED